MKSILFVIGCLVALTTAQRRPPNYSQDEMPDTSFDCRDKVVGGYYADIETDCQMFHVCVKVPGLGIQDYRFLCPNDTTFDQENQICANWYDIDCEASTLFYSDNFDLYRIDKGSLPSSKGTPIPLGPSTQRPPAAPAKKRPLIQKQDDEEEFYLQRSETGDRRLQSKDLLRGSSSGNFFNKNQGREDDFDDNYQSKDAKTADVPRRRNNPNNANNNANNKKKVAVRKLRKRPEATDIDVNAQQSYQAAPTTSPPTAASNTPPQQQQQQSTAAQNNDQTDRYYNRQNNRQSFNNQRFNTQNIDAQKSSSSSAAFNTNPATEAAVFDKTTRNQQYQPRYNTINRNTNTQASPSTTTQGPPPTTYNQPPSSPNTNTNNNNYFQSRNNRPAFDASRGNTNFARTTTQNYEVTKVATTKKYVDTQPRGFETGPTTRKYAEVQPRGFEVQKTNAFRSSVAVASTTIGYNNNNNRDFSSKSAFNNNNNNNVAVSTTYAPVTFSGNYRQNNAFAKITTQKAADQTDYQDYNGNYDSYGNQRDNNNNNNNNGQQQTSDEYVENTEKEFLKTAPSNNIRPSNFNSFAKTYTAAAAVQQNTPVTNNNNNQGQSFNNNNNQKATTNFNYEKTSSKTDFNAKSTTFNNNNNNNNFRSQSTQTQFAATNPTTRRPSTQYYQPSTTQYNNNNNNQSPVSVAASTTTYSPPKAAAPARNSGGGNGGFYQQSSSSSFKAAAPTTTYAPPAAPAQKYVEPKKAAPARPTETKKAGPIKDASYDYAYYDDTDGTEYEGTDPISDHHFGKSGDSLKIRS